MFTGIVEGMGQVVSIAAPSADPDESHRATGKAPADFVRLTIDSPGITDTLGAGDSIAINGVCLTDAGHQGTAVVLEVMGETLARTALGELSPGDRVNVERALAANARLGGHIVQGHVDGTGRLLSRTPHDHWEVFRFSLPQQLAGYVVEKGSIAVSGTSLTVSAVSEPGSSDPWFEVSLIPTTLKETILGAMEPGAAVNLEVDVLAKYVERMAAVAAASKENNAHTVTATEHAARTDTAGSAGESPVAAAPAKNKEKEADC